MSASITLIVCCNAINFTEDIKNFFSVEILEKKTSCSVMLAVLGMFGISGVSFQENVHMLKG